MSFRPLFEPRIHVRERLLDAWFQARPKKRHEQAGERLLVDKPRGTRTFRLHGKAVFAIEEAGNAHATDPADFALRKYPYQSRFDRDFPVSAERQHHAQPPARIKRAVDAPNERVPVAIISCASQYRPDGCDWGRNDDFRKYLLFHLIFLYAEWRPGSARVLC